MSVDNLYVLKLPAMKLVNGQVSGPELRFSESPNGPNTLLGYIVSAPGLPRWMSCEFGAALDEHTRGVPGADLNLYSHDWFHKIAFIAVADLPNVATNTQIIDWVNKSARFTSSLDHPLSTGCQTVVPRTRVSKLVFDTANVASVKSTDRFVDSSVNPSDVFYAVVSETDPIDPTFARAITIAPLTSRAAFAQSKTHVTALTNSYLFRHNQVSTTNISQERATAHNAAKAFIGAP